MRLQMLLPSVLLPNKPATQWVDIGRSLKQMKDQGTEIDLKVFTEAMEAMFEGKEVKMTEAQAQEVMMKFLQEQQEKVAAKRAEDAKVNLEKAKRS